MRLLHRDRATISQPNPASTVIHPLEPGHVFDATCQALNSLRDVPEDGLPATPEEGLLSLLLAQDSLRELLVSATDTPETRRRAVAGLLDRAIQKLQSEDEDAAELLRFHYQQGLSFSRSRASSAGSRKASLLCARQVLAARSGLATVLFQEEMLLRAGRREALRRRLPLRDVSDLVGRDSEMDRLRACLLAPDAHWVMTVVGIGGVGKTTLAQAAALDALAAFRFSDVFWLALDEAPWDTALPTAAEAVSFVIESLLSLLGAGALRGLPQPEQLRALRDTLTAAPYLVVIDDVQSLATATELYLRVLDSGQSQQVSAPQPDPAAA